MNEKSPYNYASLLPLFLLMIFGIVLVRSAWLNDDSFITLRTVDNFVNGHGLTWNVDERVQAFTHPLWMFLISGLYFFTREEFYTPLFISLVVSMVVFTLVTYSVKRHNLATLGALSVLIFSKAFIDFSTSGLENPLSHLLLAVFLIFLLKIYSPPTDRQIFILSLLASLAVFNRMDTILLYIPALFYLLWQRHDRRAFRQVALGMLPFLAWEIFSIIYYGTPFPNTAYAKINIGLHRADLIEMGYLYFMNSLNWDPLTLAVIGFSFVVTVWRGSQTERWATLGLVLYLLYILWTGGDFMSGRFFTVVLLGAVILLLRHLLELPVAEGAVFLMAVVVMGFIAHFPTLMIVDDINPHWDLNRIADERSYYYESAGLIYDVQNQREPHNEWVSDGRKMKQSDDKVFIVGNIGFKGFYAGPEVHIIDPVGLADPLLARLKPILVAKPRAGHSVRAIPNGYYESIKDNQNLIIHPALAEYYGKIRLITRGPIWSLERFIAIWKLNTGQYNYLLEAYQSDIGQSH